MMRTVDALVTQAIQQRCFRSACLLVSVDRQSVVQQAYGAAALDSVFDVASLTKPLATAAVLMQLVAQRRLSLRQTLGSVLRPLAGTALAALPLTAVLSHSAGLAAWRPFAEQVQALGCTQARRRLRKLVAAEPLTYLPGSQALYSDLGFILLDWLIEQLVGQPLDHAAEALIYRPIGLSRTGFVALGDQGQPKVQRTSWRFVPTERVPGRARLCGVVHDANCRAMGGVSGHAGLFSSMGDIDLILRQLSAAYRREPSLFATPVVRRFFAARPVPAATWALGWDRPAALRSSAGHAFGPRSVGHLGFTGCSIWMDLERPWWVIFLTNRVYYGSAQNPLRTLRPRLHNAIYRCLVRDRLLARPLQLA